MPTYDFKCPDCGSTESITASIHADLPVLNCHLCAIRMHQVFSPVGVVFKGTGFYTTDKRGTNAKTEKAEKEQPAAKVKSEGDKGTNGKTPKGLPRKRI